MRKCLILILSLVLALLGNLNDSSVEKEVEVESKTVINIEYFEEIDKYEKDIEMIAKVVYREARGLPLEHQAAVVWTILNRVDAEGKFGNTIEEVITSPNQYAWNPDTPLTTEQLWIARDVVEKWIMEKVNNNEKGRVLPKDYYFFSAGNDNTNWFRKEYKSTEFWNWELENPYQNFEE